MSGAAGGAVWVCLGAATVASCDRAGLVHGAVSHFHCIRAWFHIYLASTGRLTIFLGAFFGVTQYSAFASFIIPLGPFQIFDFVFNQHLDPFEHTSKSSLRIIILLTPTIITQPQPTSFLTTGLRPRNYYSCKGTYLALIIIHFTHILVFSTTSHHHHHHPSNERTGTHGREM